MNHQINIDEAIAIAYDKTYKYYNAKHNITRMLRYINIYIICINHIY